MKYQNDNEHKDHQDHPDHKEHYENHDHKDHPENKPKENENSFKKVAMATFGAISNAVEKVADVIGDATSPESLDKYAKKGEDSMASVKEKSGELFKQVKDYSSQTVEKVKSTLVDEDLKKYEDIAATKQGLLDELTKLKQTATQAEVRVEYAHTEDEFEDFKNQVSKDLGEHKTTVEKLIKHMKNLREDERKKAEAKKAEAEKEKEKLLKDLEKQQKEFSKEEMESETAHVDKAADDEIPYESPGYPKDVHARTEHAPADPQKASPSAPDKDNNTSVLETDARNDHLDQAVPPPMG